MWQWQEHAGILILGLYLCWYFAKTLPPYVLLFILYLSALGIYNNLAYPVVQLWAFTLIYICVPRFWWPKILNVITFLVGLDAVWLLMPHEYGLFNHISFDTTIMACLLPWCLRRGLYGDLKKPFIFITILFLTDIVKFHGTTALTCAGLAIAIPQLYRRRYAIPGLVALAGILVLVWKGSEFLSSTDRVDMWRTYMTWWLHNVDSLTGAGLSAFEILGPFIQVNGNNYRAMHNDFLQVLFDTGIVGFCLFLGMWGDVVRKNWGKPLSISFCAVFFVACMTYFPLHFFLSQMIVLAALRISHWGNGHGN